MIKIKYTFEAEFQPAVKASPRKVIIGLDDVNQYFKELNKFYADNSIDVRDLELRLTESYCQLFKYKAGFLRWQVSSHWENDPETGDFVCAGCGYTSSIIGDGNFCPGCGIKMRNAVGAV